MADSLRVVHWNAQSLKGKKLLLKTFLREYQVDVMLISETHLTAAMKLTLPGYITHRKDERSPQGTAYRGLAILVKRNVVHQPIDFEEHATIYALGIEVQVAGNVVRLYAAYHHNRLSSPET